ncbi:MAG: 50S ribosomal protein L3 [Clostridia bacterium]|jgi:large subunit ribosomal protein L3|nr:50S ribosomal protein L3 [Clostridia bacterium]
MKNAILGKKIGMSQIFTETGVVIPVTVVEAGPCYVSQIKTDAVDGYNAVQMAFLDTKDSRLNKAEVGHLKKANLTAKKYLKEFKISSEGLSLGSEIKCNVFTAGDKVDVSGYSKGHGFSGNVQRWNAHKQQMTHGVGPVHRSPGSLGANSTPSRVFKNHKLPGDWGYEKVTIQNLEVAKVDADRNLILIKGAIPGAKGAVVSICSAVKA